MRAYVSIVFALGLVLFWGGSQVLAQAVSPADATESNLTQSPNALRMEADAETPFAGPHESGNTSAEGIPFRQQSVVPAATLIRVAVVTVIGLALVVGVAYGLKRFLSVQGRLPSGNSRMQLLEVRRLSQRLTLFMVQVDDKIMVLAQSGDQLLTLDPMRDFEDGEKREDRDDT